MDHRLQVLMLTNAAWPEMRERFVWAEDIGVDVASVGDHFVDWTDPQRPFFEAWSYLAAAAEATERMRLSTMVTQIPLRNPAMLAHTAVAVDHISNGRLDVGIGTGLRVDPSYEMIGIENWSNAERVERFAEYAEILHQLMSQERSSFDGEYYRLDGAVTSPLPLQKPRPPIMISAMGPRMLSHTARYADIWNSLSFAQSFDEQLAQTIERVELLEAACASIGRDASEILRSFTLFDPEARQSGGAFGYYEDEGDFAERCEALFDLGFREISVYYPSLDRQKPAFEHIVREVFPELVAKRV